jgi:hypothetical protein
MLKDPPLLSDKEKRDQYKQILSIIEKAIDWDISTLLNQFSSEEKDYFKILKMSININEGTNLTGLQDIVSGTQDIKYRLYAFMHLQSKGKNISDDVDTDNQTRKDLIDKTLKKIRDSSFDIGSVKKGTNNFDLRALTTGINLILTTTLK